MEGAHWPFAARIIFVSRHWQRQARLFPPAGITAAQPIRDFPNESPVTRWHVFCSESAEMFYRNALLRCAELEIRIAGLYSALAACPAATAETAGEWEDRAREELMRSRMLRGAAELATSLEEDGPFLVEAPLDIRNVERALDVATRRLGRGTDAADVEQCIEAVESGRHTEIYAGLVEVIDTELRRVLKFIECELKALRRRNGRERKPRRLCA